MSEAPTYAAQADAVERAAVGQRGYVNRLRDLADRDDRRTLEWETQAAWTPALEAAAMTMRRVANQQAAKEALQAAAAKADRVAKEHGVTTHPRVAAIAERRIAEAEAQRVAEKAKGSVA